MSVNVHGRKAVSSVSKYFEYKLSYNETVRTVGDCNVKTTVSRSVYFGEKITLGTASDRDILMEVCVTALVTLHRFSSSGNVPPDQ